jgi:hypothetical protein
MDYSNSNRTLNPDASFELYFRALLNGGRGLAFPCDAEGHVDLDTLPEPARNDYFYAHALMGRDFAWAVRRVGETPSLTLPTGRPPA